MKGLFKTPLLFFSLLLLCNCSISVSNKLDLSGEWKVRLDSLNVGAKENWAKLKLSGTTINLPGTLDDAGIGKPNNLEPVINNYVMSSLSRKHQYIGAAWYQKEIEVSKDWKDKNIVLNLERIIWESKVYVDGEFVGSANSLVGSHNYNLSSYLSPGKHLLTISVDNSNKLPFINVAGNRYPEPVNQDMAHGYTNHTQIKWNGILGDISLNLSDKNKLKNLQIYPNYHENNILASFESSIASTKHSVVCEITSLNGEVVFKDKVQPVFKNNMVSFIIEKPKALKLWNEFNPELYNVTIHYLDQVVQTRFGFKSIANKEGDLTLNGDRIFLRGNLECVIFPLTGHPPMDKEAWLKLISKAKNYGLNHLRFHSWCPPEAAFEAADEAGFYYQVELPHWSLHVGKDEKTAKFLKSEAEKIIRDYGNHPSFIFMSMGNELEGDFSFLNEIVSELKTEDNRHLYATTSFSFQKPMGTKPELEDEFFVTQWTDKGWVRGQGVFNRETPKFDKDYSAASEYIKTPLISHEIGQYAVYPDMTEISKYTGVLEPLNFIAVKQDLEYKGLIDLAPDFTYNSGKLAAILYKEEIERALKTPSLDGFQLLQLQDFPGQGTALVGLLNAFWESKGIISAEEFSDFNSELVPLIRFEKAVYKSGETFNASIEIANFYRDIVNQTIDWSIIDDAGSELKSGSVNGVNLIIGNNLGVGHIEYPIEINEAKRLTIKVGLKDSKYKNSWHIWVYPKEVSTIVNDVFVTSSFDIANLMLQQGKKVLLSPNPKTLQGIDGRFVPVFWSPVHFPNQPTSMGLLLDKDSPAFNSFPTSTHTDWQWWDLCINSKSIITDSLNVTPIVRVIDNFVTNHHLSTVFEMNIGSGKLIFSSMDLISNLDDRPVARQLHYSLLNYMMSTEFNPTKTIKMTDLDNLNKLQ